MERDPVRGGVASLSSPLFAPLGDMPGFPRLGK